MNLLEVNLITVDGMIFRFLLTLIFRLLLSISKLN